MDKIYTAMGLMSGTSMDGIDASIIVSDGYQECFFKFDKYLKYSEDLRTKLMSTRDKVLKLDDLKSCLLYTSPSPRDLSTARMRSSA